MLNGIKIFIEFLNLISKRPLRDFFFEIIFHNFDFLLAFPFSQVSNYIQLIQLNYKMRYLSREKYKNPDSASRPRSRAGKCGMTTDDNRL